MIKIGDICPLVFNPLKDTFVRESCYIQKFYTTDKILLQVLSDDISFPTAKLNNKISGLSYELSFSSYQVSSSITLYHTTITGQPDSVYTVTLLGIESEPFTISSSQDLLDCTSLIRCSHKDNNSYFDNIFWIEEERQIFEFRVECGFKPSGIAQKIDNEQYRDQTQEITQLYSVPYETYDLSIGAASGVPYWVGKMINRMLCVSFFEINDKLFVRSETSVPEGTLAMEDGQLFYFSVTLEPAYNEVSGLGGTSELPEGSLIPNFNIVNPVDGEILRYVGQEGAWVNDNTFD